MATTTIHRFMDKCPCTVCCIHYRHSLDPQRSVCPCAFCVQECGLTHEAPQHTHGKCAPPPEPSSVVPEALVPDATSVLLLPLFAEQAEHAKSTDAAQLVEQIAQRIRSQLEKWADLVFDPSELCWCDFCLAVRNDPTYPYDPPGTFSPVTSGAVVIGVQEQPDPDKFIRKQLNANLRGVFT